jgi:hypothetical protein
MRALHDPVFGRIFAAGNFYLNGVPPQFWRPSAGSRFPQNTSRKSSRHEFPRIQIFLYGTADRILGCLRMAMSQQDRR